MSPREEVKNTKNIIKHGVLNEIWDLLNSNIDNHTHTNKTFRRIAILRDWKGIKCSKVVVRNSNWAQSPESNEKIEKERKVRSNRSEEPSLQKMKCHTYSICYNKLAHDSLG